MSDLRTNIPEDYVFRVCELFLGRGKDEKPMGATNIARWLEDQGYRCSRERVYRLVELGKERGFMKLCPPQEMALAQKLSEKYPQAAGDIRVLNVRGSATNDHLGAAGADLLLSLIREIGANGKPVHIGFGAGSTIRKTARSLGFLLRAESNLPPLVLHALSSGFSVDDPITAPVSFFSFFNDLGLDVRFVGLFAPAVVNCSEYKRVQRQPGVRESFERASEVDIVVTSLASRSDPHGLLKKFMDMTPGAGVRTLQNAGWVGDVQWRPYSENGPIPTKTGKRAVTVFGMGDLLEMARTPGKHVVLVAGNCNECGRNKTDALKPLLTQPGLRVWNHLVMDAASAKSLLK